MVYSNERFHVNLAASLLESLGPIWQASGSQAQRPSTLLGPRWDRRVLGFNRLARAGRRCLHLVQVPEQLVDFLIGLLSRDTLVGGLGGRLLGARTLCFPLAPRRLYSL